jgi:hypothetical protein
MGSKYDAFYELNIPVLNHKASAHIVNVPLMEESDKGHQYVTL